MAEPQFSVIGRRPRARSGVCPTPSRNESGCRSRTGWHTLRLRSWNFVTDVTPIQGDLQAQIMPALWRLESGTVDQVRSALPERYRSAYTTVQTVLNRLAERGLLSRERQGNAIVYRPRLTEAEYLSRSIGQSLAGASHEARRTVLAQLIGDLKPEELGELRRLARTLASERSKHRS